VHQQLFLQLRALSLPLSLSTPQSISTFHSVRIAEYKEERAIKLRCGCSTSFFFGEAAFSDRDDFKFFVDAHLDAQQRVIEIVAASDSV